MKKRSQLIIMLMGFFMFGGALLPSYAAVSDVTVSGHLLGGVNHLLQQNREISSGARNQFDFAANVDLSFNVNKTMSGMMQFQSSPGVGNLGFPGPEWILTDINLSMALTEVQTMVTFGSFDMPFGQQVPYLSNNANMFSNALSFNPLLYSALAGPAGTLNTVGVKAEYTGVSGYSAVVALSNGTTETSSNQDGGFATLFSVVADTISPGVHVSGTLLGAKDRGDATAANGFNADFSGQVIDVHVDDIQGLQVKGFYALLEYDDGDADTEDDVTSWMIEGSKMIEKYIVSARISVWHPKDDDGSGSGISTAIKNPGFGTTQGAVTVLTDQKLTRYQLGLGYYLDDATLLKLELFQDDYQKMSSNESTDVFGVVAFVNVAF